MPLVVSVIGRTRVACVRSVPTILLFVLRSFRNVNPRATRDALLASGGTSRRAAACSGPSPAVVLGPARDHAGATRMGKSPAMPPPIWNSLESLVVVAKIEGGPWTRIP